LIWPSPAASITAFGWIEAPALGRPRPKSSEPDGSFKWTTTVEGSFASTASTLFQTAFPGVETFPHRLSDATTSVAVISLPVWNLRAVGSVIVYGGPPSATV